MPPPEIVQHAVDPDEHLIEVPGVSGPGPPPSEPSRELRTKFPAPVPDALVGHDHAALGQDQLDIPQTEAEYMIQPDRVADDLGREAMPRIGGGLWRHPVSLARFPSGHQLPLSWRCRLEAQREACEAYIASQQAEGWVLVPEHYDDAGRSGATLERPALQRMLADLEAGRVDIIVTYKLDRISRSLTDFVKLIELFEGHEV